MEINLQSRHETKKNIIRAMVPSITSNKIPMEISIDYNLEVQLQTEKK